MSQTTLLELLEAPQLMDTCVRNGIYDEALDLQAFIGRLGMLHPELPIVQLLMAQVGRCCCKLIDYFYYFIKNIYADSGEGGGAAAIGWRWAR